MPTHFDGITRCGYSPGGSGSAASTGCTHQSELHFWRFPLVNESLGLWFLFCLRLFLFLGCNQDRMVRYSLAIKSFPATHQTKAARPPKSTDVNLRFLGGVCRWLSQEVRPQLLYLRFTNDFCWDDPLSTQDRTRQCFGTVRRPHQAMGRNQTAVFHCNDNFRTQRRDPTLLPLPCGTPPKQPRERHSY